MSDEQYCKHCHARIIAKRFLGRDTWVHQPAGSAFQDNQHEYCHMTVARPEDK